MEKLFLSVLNMSLTGAYVIAAILLVRLLLKKAPKVISYALWTVAGFRLVFPFSIQSVLSLLPFKTAPIPQDIAMQAVPRFNSGVTAIDNAISAVLPAATPATSVNPLQLRLLICSYLWMLGIAALLVYSCVSILLLKRRLRGAVSVGDNIYVADNLKTPFVLGLFRPKIYIPSGLSDEERRYITLHERTHIQRRDHIVKMLAYFVLCLHWFNPLVWVAFVLMGADMEMSCDERVMRELGGGIKTAYSLSLVRVAAGHRILNGSPLAFGEGGMKERVKNVLQFKKHSRVMIIAAVALAAVVITGFALNKPSAPSIPDEDAVEFRSEETHFSVNVPDGWAVRANPRIPAGEDTEATPDEGLQISLRADEDNWISVFSQYGRSSIDEEYYTKTEFSTAQGNLGSLYRGVGTDASWYLFLEQDIAPDSYEAVVRFESQGLIKQYENDIMSILTSIKIYDPPMQREGKRDLMTLDDVRKIAEKYGKTLTLKHLSAFAHTDVGSGLYVMHYPIEGGAYALSVGSGDMETVLYATLVHTSDGEKNEIDIRYYDVARFIADGSKVPVDEPPAGLVELPDFKPENPTGVYDGVFDGKAYGGLFNTAIVNKYSDPNFGFLVYAPTIHGVYEEKGELKAIVTVFYEHFRLQDKYVTMQGGGIIPAAITFQQDENGGWVEQEYAAVGDSPDYLDGAYFADSVRKLCTLPVSGARIEGLADRVLDDYRNYDARQTLLQQSLIEHLLQYGRNGISLIHPDGSVEQLT